MRSISKTARVAAITLAASLCGTFAAASAEAKAPRTHENTPAVATAAAAHAAAVRHAHFIAKLKFTLPHLRAWGDHESNWWEPRKHLYLEHHAKQHVTKVKIPVKKIQTILDTTPASTAAATPTASPASVPEPDGMSGNWAMAFDDEFNGTSLNTSVWNPSGWTNNNMSIGSQASNVTESGGDLVLQVASGSSGAQVETIPSAFAGVAVGDFAEASVEFSGSGSTIYNWPAWWISGPNWPAAGENDIAEGLGTLTVNYHSPSGAHNQGTIPGTWAGGFHTYGIYRGSNYCNVYWDGQLVKTYKTDDNGQPENLIFTDGIGNTAAYGASGAVKVDWVRVWSPS